MAKNRIAQNEKDICSYDDSHDAGQSTGNRNTGLPDGNLGHGQSLLELEPEAADDIGAWHGEAGIDLVALVEQVLAAHPYGHPVQDAEGGADVPKDEILLHRGVTDRGIQTGNVLHSGGHMPAAVGEEASDVQFMLGGGHHGIFHVQETVVGVHRPVTGDAPGGLHLHSGIVNFPSVLVQRTATVLVTGFVPVDPYYDSSREALNSRQDTVMDLFACGRLPVGDRYPTVTADKGKGSPDFFEVQVTISWIDSRPEVWGPPAQAPMMARYELNREFPGNKTER